MAISPQQLTVYLYSAHRAVIFAIAQLSCSFRCLLSLFCFIADIVTVALVLQCCVRLSSATLCIVAKRCVLEQKLLLTAYRKSYK